MQDLWRKLLKRGQGEKVENQFNLWVSDLSHDAQIVIVTEAVHLYLVYEVMILERKIHTTEADL